MLTQRLSIQGRHGRSTERRPDQTGDNERRHHGIKVAGAINHINNRTTAVMDCDKSVRNPFKGAPRT